MLTQQEFDQLKDKWFVKDDTVLIDEVYEDDDLEVTVLFPAYTCADLGLILRHQGSSLNNHTDGNLVLPLIDGAAYMQKWYDLIKDGDTNIVYNTNWAFGNVQIVPNDPNSFSLKVLVDAKNRGAEVYQFIDGNLMARLPNFVSTRDLLFEGIIAHVESRFPTFGSTHQKFLVAKSVDPTKGTTALVGSVDIIQDRLDDSAHTGNYPVLTHDFGVSVQGPAVQDIEHVFLSRWNDSSSVLNGSSPLNNIPHSVGLYPFYGSHSVQVLTNYGVGGLLGGYTWNNEEGEGEFAIWASTLNAIRKAEKYIYIEDQTLLTFGWPACCDSHPNRLAQQTDLIYQLGEALKKPNMRVGLIVNNHLGAHSSISSSLSVTRSGSRSKYENFQKHYSLNYLKSIAQEYGTHFFVAYLHNGQYPISIHSKMFIADDEFALIGSANMDSRSMCYDGEIKLGIVDQNEEFVRDLRMALFLEHSEAPDDNVFVDPIAGFDEMKRLVENESGRLKVYDYSLMEMPRGHADYINKVAWPYAGPSILR